MHNHITLNAQLFFNILDTSLIVVQVETTSSINIIILLSSLSIYFLFILKDSCKFFILSSLDNLACCLVVFILFTIFFLKLIHTILLISLANNSD
jgi:hypothetical protein